jgi:hypothetical protein
MNDELGDVWKTVVLAFLRYYNDYRNSSRRTEKKDKRRHSKIRESVIVECKPALNKQKNLGKNFYHTKSTQAYESLSKN